MVAPVLIRASSLNDYPECQRRSAARMFWPEIVAAGFTLVRTVRSIGAHIGTGVHAGAAAMLREMVARGRLSTPDESVGIAITALRQRAQDEGAMFDRQTPNLNSAESFVKSMTLAYQYDIAPNVKPVAIEERLEARYNDRLTVSGQSDLVAREPGAVRDTKTGKRPGYYMPQIGCYALLNRAHRALAIEKLFIDFVPRRKAPQARSIEYDVATAEQVASGILAEIDRDLLTFRHGDVARGLGAGDQRAFMANPNSHLCGAKWCPAFHSDFCPESRTKGG
jgi:hypothetical protein